MGVQGLWELLTPVGRRVSVDSLGNKKLAVDRTTVVYENSFKYIQEEVLERSAHVIVGAYANVTQEFEILEGNEIFMKAMRDEHGDMIRNAHLLGFFRRICKLLYLRIKPVFVFDGGTPVLKRRTVIARRKQRENAQFKIRKTAEKLLLNHIRSRKLEEIASEINAGPRKTPSQQSSKTIDISDKSSGAGVLEGSVETGAELGPGCPSEKSDQEAADALLAASLAAGYDQNTEAENGVMEEIIEASDEDNEVEELVLPSNVKGLDPALLASLPASMQLELLVQMREQLVAENRQKFQKVSKLPSSFSQLQIQAYLKTVAFRREITEVQRAAGGGGVGGVPTTRIASTSDREFIFSNSFQGEKPAPSTIEEQRRSQRATSGTKEVVQGSFPVSKSAFFSAISKSQTIPLEKVPEEGVVSLVSTEINGEPESNTSCSVHTYVDEKGHVRVSRVRGMGVRMTRDLQWNLYLMKDVEARKSMESGTASDPPIIPSNSLVDLPVAAAKNDVDGLAGKQGLQISFVDDGNPDYGKDGELFEELVTLKEKDTDVANLQGSSLSGNNDEHLRVSNTEGEDEFEWEEGVVDKGLDCSVEEEEKAECFQVSEVPTSASIREGQDRADLVVQRKEEEEGKNADRGEDGGFGMGVDYSVLEDKDLAEALELSLTVKDGAVNTEEHVIIEDGPSSDESEVEWEDGTGAVTVTGFDAVGADTDTSKIQSGPSEEAQIEEAIRRSLEDFRSPAKLSSRLVIKEPSEDDSNSVGHVKEDAAKLSPRLRADAESEEIYFARERTRKGKARLGEEENVPRQCAPIIPIRAAAELEKCADTKFINMACIQDTPQTVAGANENNSSSAEKQAGGTGTEPANVSEAEHSYSGHVHGCVPVSEPIVNSHVQFVPTTAVSVGSGEGDFKASLTYDPLTSPSRSNDQNVPMEQGSHGQVAPCTVDHNLAAQSTVRNKIDMQKGVLGRFADQVSTKAPGQPSQPSQPSTDAELLRDAEEMDLAKEREELRLKEAQVLFERERLAKEEEELQAELEAEREEIQAGLERERELLAREELELRATQKKNERNADSVTGEMFTDVQELLRMFGLPYVVAPMEAEAQCAYLDATNLVDGVVTEDSDVFLFGGRNVYKNLFDDRKYVETYYVKDLESEMGMNREKLVRMALLLGSDYTEGISGIGIVNAIEVVNAFEEEDGLQKFRMWIDSPDLSLFDKVRGRAKVKSLGKGRAKGKASGGEVENIEEESEGGGMEQTEDNRFSPRQRIFISEHRAVSKNWNIPDSFPSAAVIAAYISPMIDKSKETFSFGRPDLEALRRFCNEKLGWNKDKADELLLPVLNEYDRRETQTRLDSFYHFNHRFAKIRSRRIQKAVTGITGQRSEELMELPPHLVASPPAAKSLKRSRTAKNSVPGDETNGPSGISHSSSIMDGEPTSTADGAQAGVVRVGRGRRGRGRGRNSTLATSGEVENEEVENGEVGEKITNRKTYGRGKGRGRETAGSSATRRSRGRGKSRGHVGEGDASSLGASKSEQITEDYMGEVKSLKRKASQLSPVVRRSTRRVCEVNYVLDNSDEDAGGACSDGEIQAAELRENSIHETNEQPQGPHGHSSESFEGVAHMDPYRSGSRLPSEAHQYERGGGICRDESGGSGGSEEAGQLHFEKEQPSHLARGGGFCLDEDEVSHENLESAVSGVTGQQQQPSFTLGGGFCVPEDEEEVLAEASETAEQNSIVQRRGTEHLEACNVQNSDSLSSDRLVHVSDDVTPAMKHPEDSGEPVELGLRAMPMMRRKKRKSV